ncbi:ATP-binding protein [Streptomyces sp. NRRL WC-3618]|uniref:ATP-binding protein n=1 Tax=Streptomyces sp. NRRL WC-3618 TaxID=1519490 RepID=UPI000AD319DF|nr:ATP-binding protein [Streptomyces sp. NRRL WC-3618]
MDWLTANQRYLMAVLDVLRLRLSGGDGLEDAVHHRDELRKAMPAPPALEVIEDGFELSGFERDLLLMCAGVELDTEFARACAEAQGASERTWASFGLGLAKLPDTHWTALTPAGPLRRWHLVELTHPETPTSSALRIDERVLHALTGIAYLDPRIQPLTVELPEPKPLPVPLREAGERVAAHWSSRPESGSALLYGRPVSDLRSAAVGACAQVSASPVCLRAAALPQAPDERDLLARLCERETVLDGAAWIIEVDDTVPDCSRLALDLADRLDAPTVVISREPIAGSGRRVEVGPARADDMRTVWREALGPAAAGLSTWIDRIAGQFDLGLEAVDAAAAEALAAPEAGTALWEACRRLARPSLDGLAQQIEPRARWVDLVLPDHQLRVLRELTAHVRHRVTVLEDWGFAARTSRGLGTAALFSGPSGTGKTLAAEVIAGELRLDLYRVDLSQVVSKYIGETEKNLRGVFDAAEAGGAVLLFDEADALFGKRSEVKDSHDRHANIEVGYLLQRIEAYRGLAVLTTNLKDTLDPAFLRRLRFAVHFTFPDASARTEIWRRVFPPETPTDGLDPAALAQLSVPGGTISSIALSAAYLAADSGEPVRMHHLLAAARTEYAKLERPLTTTEVTGWTTT